MTVALAAACSSGAGDGVGDAATTSPASAPATPGLVAGVATANPLATAAGAEVLGRGGSAVDAAVAVQTVLGLVEPQSSGLGGGAFLVHHDADTAATMVYDGREEAPAGADSDLFIGSDGAPLGFLDASGSGRAVGAPGVVALLAAAHDDHGVLAWSELFAPAIALATDGFEVSPRMADALGVADGMGASPSLVDLYSGADGELLEAGDRFTNPDYADTLSQVATDWRSFYEGDIAEAIVASAGAPPLPGTLTTTDLAGYEARRLDALCAPYRTFTVCGAPPPSSGGLAVASLLGQLDRFDLGAEPDADAWHLYAEASQRAYADRDEYVADDRFVPVPVTELLAPDYLGARAAEIDPLVASTEVTAGVIPGYERGTDATDEASGTSHFVIVDAGGDVVSMTTSVESVLGSRRAAAGFVLNNQLTDFSFEAEDEVGPVANRVEAGKRPRSSMAPTIVFDGAGAPIVAVGSPGGSSIIAYVAKTLLAGLDWGMTAEDAVALPNIVARSGAVSIEDGPGTVALGADLEGRGHVVRAGGGENSGVHLLVIDEGGVVDGAADPRREGTVEFIRP